MQGRTGPLEQVPEQLLSGQHIMLGSGSTSMILGTVDKNTVMWALSLKGPQSRAGEIAAHLQDPASAQVKSGLY